ncbi:MULTISPECIES: Uma2 family endonuclease [Okeania]|uniref:Uma2 family endonuclease n=1 Tax=Okeania TaxID=1458928 RepID=UPI0019619687|nr:MULTISPECIES: Uma2 family endonuclease [Okeania]
MNAIGSGLTHLKWCIRIASQKLLLPRQAIALQQAVKRETWLCGEVGRKALREAIEMVRENTSAGFKLLNCANRSPDTPWIPIEKWNNLTPEQRTKFLPLCPDFLIELMSPFDSLSETRDKMKEYLENGMQLGWLINPKN